MADATFGVEEEYLLLDAETGTPTNRAAELVEAVPQLGDRAEREFLSSQLETATDICTTAEEALYSLQNFRTTVSQEAEKLGILLAGTGLPPLGNEEDAVVTPKQRYYTLGDEIRGVGEDMFVTGTHVHVSIPSRDAGVDAMARLARWSPVLLGMTANSPIWQGTDTGFASWRHLKSLVFPVMGYPPEFHDGDDYARSVELMVDSGMIIDAGAVTWIARLSVNYPTIELRVADAQLNPRDAVSFGLIVRALVSQGLLDYQAGRPRPDYPRGLVNGSLWLAARNGMETNLIDPLTGFATFAFDALEHMLDYARPELTRTGDLERVEAYVEQLDTLGSPAQRQRKRFEDAGIEGLLELYREGSQVVGTA